MRRCGVIHGKHHATREHVGTPLIVLLFFARLRDLRDLRGLRANCGADGCHAAIEEPAGSRAAREATRSDAKNSNMMETGIVPTDGGAANHHSCRGCSSVHDGPARLRVEDRRSAPRRSSRDQTKRLRSPSKSTTYTVLIPKRWDATGFLYVFDCARECRVLARFSATSPCRSCASIHRSVR